MLFNKILHFISLNLFDSNYSNRKTFTNNEDYYINFCSFYNILTSTSNGGALSIISSLKINLLNSFFNNIILLEYGIGGGGYLSGSQVNVSFCCFNLCSCGYAGFGIFQDSIQSNILNHTVFLNCYDQNPNSCDSWCLRGGFSISISLNCVLCLNKYREACGHFGWNPLCYSCYINNINNNGVYIYFPYSKEPEGIHEFTNYINNTVSSSIILFSPFDKLKNNIFLKNYGIISTLFYGEPTGLFQNCIFDSVFSGIITNTINCNFEFNYIQTINIKISNFFCYNNYQQNTLTKSFNLIFFNLNFFILLIK